MAQKTKFGIVAGLAGAALMVSAAPTWAVTINLNNDPAVTGSNAGFESGVLSPWVASSNGAGVYVPNATDYTAGGAPAGTHVAFTPATGGAGAGILSLELTKQFVAGNVYDLSVWVGMPFLVQGTAGAAGVQGTQNCTGLGPTGCANHTSNTTFSIDLTYATGPGGVGGGSAGGGLTATIAKDAVSISSLGIFTLYTIEVTDNSVNNADIIINLRSDSTSISQPHQVDFDIGSTVPLPAALPLFAGGLGVIGLLARRRKQKNAAA